jgi:hypothetical protein
MTPDTPKITGSRGDRLQALRCRLEAHEQLTPADVNLLIMVEAMIRPMDMAETDLSLTTIVSQATGQGRLNLVIDKTRVIQLEPVKAREIAWMLLEASAVAEAEAAVLRFMRQKVGIDADRAAYMLQDFRRYRDEDPGTLLVDDKEKQ